MTKTKKRKSKSCNRGYPCGGSCISRGYNCRKRLKGQAGDYANWLKLQGDKMGDKFNVEAGVRLSKQANSQGIKASKPDIPQGTLNKARGFLVESMIKAVKEDEEWLAMAQSQLDTDNKDIKKIKRKISKENKFVDSKQKAARLKKFKIELNKLEKQKKETEQEIARLNESIDERNKRIGKRKPKLSGNQIQPFTRLSDLDRELSALKKKQAESLRKDINLLDAVKNRLNEMVYERTNQVVPFKRKRTQDFKEEESYLELRLTYNNLLNKIWQELERLVNAANQI